MKFHLSAFTFLLMGFSIAQASRQISCDIRQWDHGIVHMDVKDKEFILAVEADDDDFPTDTDWLSVQLDTTVGPVTAIYANASFRLQYELKLGQQAAVVIAEGKDRANLTVFLGPLRGDNNGLNVSCHLLRLK